VLTLFPGHSAAIENLEQVEHSNVGMLTNLTYINVMLVVFNLIPAFPMDGGRVLRALLAMVLPYARATHIAARIGQALAVVFVLLHLLPPPFDFAFIPLFRSPLIIFIALFIFLGAQQEAAMAQMKDLSLNLPVSEAMVTHLVRLPPEATLEDAVEALLRTSQHEFPVVDSEDRILGVLTRDRLIAALKQRGSTAAVADVMQRDLPTVRADEPFDKAFQLMQESAFPALPVVDRFGRLRGLITPENVGELMMVSSLLPKGGRPAWRGSPS